MGTDGLSPPAAPLAPPSVGTPEVNAAGTDARRRAAAAGGFMDDIKTSPMGVPGGETTGKTLLGQ